ncbi:HDOD domain-containing protein [Sedimenticola sp.]|uniref:HDOD domain-containing protein n=1 Tax=Sedimenticola sp. TaxID=1940285 RepID=UPI00258F34C4|nr:HDOD domain-containing protein [Sedimenticola sp.]MCW8902680.1 HDOD domain-containing protein [Sedimenticola sp.]
MICISCGRTHRYISSSVDLGMHWLRQDESTRLGICSFCPDSVAAWDQGARDVRDLAAAKLKTERETDLPGWLIKHAKLPSLPHVLIEIYKELESETAGIERMIQLLETDPGLTARTLQIGNSAYYGAAKQITRVEDAILRVGPFDLWALLISTEVKSLFFGIRPDLMDMNSFWQHSLFTACACRVFAEQQRQDSAGELFVAGLIHDVGKLLFLQMMPIEYADVINRHIGGDEGAELEVELLGIDHAQLGARLFENWELPGILIKLTASHHTKSSPSEQVTLLRRADKLAHEYLDHKVTNAESQAHTEPAIQPIAALFQQLTELVL